MCFILKHLPKWSTHISVSLDLSRYSFGAALPKCLPPQNSLVSGKGVLSKQKGTKRFDYWGLSGQADREKNNSSWHKLERRLANSCMWKSHFNSKVSAQCDHRTMLLTRNIKVFCLDFAVSSPWFWWDVPEDPDVPEVVFWCAFKCTSLGAGIIIWWTWELHTSRRCVATTPYNVCRRWKQAPRARMFLTCWLER